MQKFLLKILVVSTAVMFSAYLLPGVEVKDFVSALLVAVVLSFLNAFLKPVLIIISFPITVLTLGLFLLVINALLIMLASYMLKPGFVVDGFWWALLFSFVLSFTTSVLEGLLGTRLQVTDKNQY
ncbi:MAG: phage holin family protein [Flavobacteriales bacterium]